MDEFSSLLKPLELKKDPKTRAQLCALLRVVNFYSKARSRGPLVTSYLDEVIERAYSGCEHHDSAINSANYCHGVIECIDCPARQLSLNIQKEEVAYGF